MTSKEALENIIKFLEDLEHSSILPISAFSGYFQEIKVIYKDLNKLGQLEDIEEELGIDLITLYKAFRYGIYVKKGKHNGFVNPRDLKGRLGWQHIVDFANKVEYSQPYEVKLIFGKTGICLSSLSYGKEWALTKEELL